MEEHILNLTGEELDAKLASIDTKATNQIFYTYIPMHPVEGWYQFGDGIPTHYAIDISIDGIFESDSPKVSVNYDQGEQHIISTWALENYSKTFSNIKAIFTYNGGITVVIHEDIYYGIESGNFVEVDLPIQLEVTR